MNLLVLSPWFPAPPDNGSRLRAFHLIREWAKAGHTIRLIAGLQPDFADTADRAALESVCESVQVFPWQWHDGAAKSDRFALLSPVPRSIAQTDHSGVRDAVAAQFARLPDACVAMELAAAPFIPRGRNGVPVLLDQVEVSGVARAVHSATSAKTKLRVCLTRAKHDAYWRRELSHFDAITAVSDGEANAVRDLLGANKPVVHVVANGVDTASYAPRTALPVPGRLLYSGSTTYPPNQDAVAWFVRDILPRIASKIPDAHLLVTGKYTPDVAATYANNPRVRLAGFVPNMRPMLADTTVCVVPLAVGGGTRLKILEAWAAGVPVVSTQIGAAGLRGSMHGEHLLIADTAETFADACVRVLTEPQTAARISANARALVGSHYEWRTLAAQITGILETLRVR